ncbi:uncharacterized protein LOC142760571 [Rhinoderma darwinii]|uniref:uncharacterized protein LOC142760571 n=1 Tax=Rhinoderma darwinii TaxID=43563 RepID=UPI003F677FD1
MPRGMDVERLLVLVQGHPEIWDTRSEAYHNRTAKEDAWEEVAKELFGQEWESGRTRDRSRLVQEIKTRWRSCRDQFRREMGERGRSGDGASRKRPYMYTQQLMFLKDIMEMRTTTDNLEDTAEETDVGESRPEPPAAPVLPPSPEPTPLEPAPGQATFSQVISVLRNVVIRRLQFAVETSLGKEIWALTTLFLSGLGNAAPCDALADSSVSLVMVVFHSPMKCDEISKWLRTYDLSRDGLLLMAGMGI